MLARALRILVAACLVACLSAAHAAGVYYGNGQHGLLPGFQKPVVASGGASTWNASDKNAGITLSGGNLTATGSNSVSYRGVRTTLGMAADTGKYCWSSTVVDYQVEFDIGVANSSAGLSADGRGDANATVIDDGGNIYVLSGYGTYIGSNIRTPGTVVMTCIDTASGVRKGWFAKDGTFDGNPAVGSGGWSLPTGTVYGFYVARYTDSATLNASPTGKPSGFGNAP